MSDSREAMRAAVEALPKLLAIINRVGCLYGLNAEERSAQDKGAAALSFLRVALEAREPTRNFLGEALQEWSRAYPRMNIYAEPGSQVMFDGRGGYPNEQATGKKALIMRGVYTVERITVHSSSSTVKLAGIAGQWNTVMFSEPPFASPAAATQGAR